MKNLKLKLIAIAVLIALITITGISVNASNEGLSIVNITNDTSVKYIVYIIGHEKTDFEFAFSNDINAEKTSLIYDFYGTDGEEENKIIYINESMLNILFVNPTYVWARKVGTEEYLVEGIEIDLSNVAIDTDLQFAKDIAFRIEMSSGTKTTETYEGEKKITVTVGKLILENKDNNYEYKMSKVPTAGDNKDLIVLAEEISSNQFKSKPITERIDTYMAFKDMYDNLMPGNIDWEPVENHEILQPEDSQSGDQYVVWVRDIDNQIIDVQFMTSIREYREEKIKELIKETVKLPVTGDDYTLVIAFVVLIIITIAVYIGIKKSKKTEEK